jgi:hypothetical protein
VLSGDLSFALDEDTGLLYVYGLVEEQRLGSDTQEFTATFNKRGTVTGTVYVVNTGEIHPDTFVDHGLGT